MPGGGIDTRKIRALPLDMLPIGATAHGPPERHTGVDAVHSTRESHRMQTPTHDPVAICPPKPYVPSTRKRVGV